MKPLCSISMIAVFLWYCSFGMQAQTTQTESPKAGSEYNVLDAWSGTWFNSTPTFTDRRTCIEDGATFYPNGKVEESRWTWNFSDDWMSFVVIGENLKDSNWWKAFEGKGTKSK